MEYVASVRYSIGSIKLEMYTANLSWLIEIDVKELAASFINASRLVRTAANILLPLVNWIILTS